MVKLNRLLQESFFELEPKNIQAKTGRFLKISQKTAHFKKRPLNCASKDQKRLKMHSDGFGGEITHQCIHLWDSYDKNMPKRPNLGQMAFPTPQPSILSSKLTRTKVWPQRTVTRTSDVC